MVWYNFLHKITNILIKKFGKYNYLLKYKWEVKILTSF